MVLPNLLIRWVCMDCRYSTWNQDPSPDASPRTNRTASKASVYSESTTQWFQAFSAFSIFLFAIQSFNNFSNLAGKWCLEKYLVHDLCGHEVVCDFAMVCLAFVCCVERNGQCLPILWLQKHHKPGFQANHSGVWNHFILWIRKERAIEYYWLWYSLVEYTKELFQRGLHHFKEMSFDSYHYPSGQKINHQEARRSCVSCFVEPGKVQPLWFIRHPSSVASFQ